MGYFAAPEAAEQRCGSCVFRVEADSVRTTTRPTSVWSAVIGRAAVAGLALLGAAQSLSASPFLHLYGSCRAVRDMAVDGDRLWLATSGGLVLYREGSEPKIYSVVNDMKDIDLTSMVLESTDRIWLGSTDGHVIEFNPRTERFTAYNSLAYVGWDIACMRPFGPYLLLGSRKGLSVFSRSAKRALWNATRFGALVESSVRAIETAGDTIALVLPSGVAWLKAPDLRLVNLNDPGVWTTVPADTSAAAIIDGAGRVKIFFTIILPLSKPALWTMSLFTFIAHWNEYMWPLVSVSDPKYQMIQVGISQFVSGWETRWTYRMAASALTVVPIIIFFFFVQKQFVEGISVSGIKE